MDNIMKRLFKALPTLIRSIFYQANWNIENMQGTGFSWLLKDLSKRFNIGLGNIGSNKRADYFNTNPYFVTFMLGMFLKEAESGQAVDEYKSTYASVFGALGDSFFWHSLRPLTFFLSLFIALYEPMFAMFFYLIFFNIFNIGFKFLGFYLGYNYGTNVIDLFRTVSFANWSDIADMASIFFMGGTFALAIKYISNSDPINSVAIFKTAIFFIVGFVTSKYINAPFTLIAGAIIVTAIMLLQNI